MQSRIFTRTLLADLFVFAVLHSLLSFFCFFLIGGFRPFLTAVVMLAPFLGMTVVRLKVNNLAAFLGLHFLLCFFPIWIQVEPATASLMFLALLIAAMHSMIMRLRGGWWPERGVTFIAVGLNTSLALLVEYLGIPAPGRVLAFWSFAMIAVHLVCSQTSRVDSSLEILAGAARQPVQVTMRFNNFILGIFMLPVLAAGVIAALLPLDEAGRMLVSFILSIYRWLNDLFMRLLAWLGGPAAEEPGTAVRPDLSGLLPQAREAPTWLKIVEQLFIWLIWAVIIGAVAYAAIRGLYSLYKQFYAERAGEGEMREYIGPSLEPEDLRKAFHGFRNRLPSFGRSEEERIRRKYYRKVRRHIRKGVEVHPADTTGEIADRLREREDVDELTGKYDRARYNAKRDDKTNKK